ncbi:MAG: glucosaminidase domain-containing protein [Proteobacteria bacterium]|nr:glucosaminidase domain-containing protein [Pseudomonadota bacterium]
MRFLVKPALDRGRRYAFPATWAAVLLTGIGMRAPLPAIDATALLNFNPLGQLASSLPDFLPPMNADTAALIFVRHDLETPDEQAAAFNVNVRDIAGGHGRFAAPGNAVRRQVQSRAINPRTAEELAGFFRDQSYTLADVRQGLAVPPIRLERVPDDLNTKDGVERKMLFITALLPVILEVNQRVTVEREQLLNLRDKFAENPATLTDFDRAWLMQLADRYEMTIDQVDKDQLDQLARRVDIVPPSMAIAQAGIESGWGTSFAARTGNALFGQIQSVGQHAVSVSWKPGAGMPQPFASVGEAAEAYVVNLNTHPAYAAFRTERAAMRDRGEQPDGYKLIGQLLRYSERGLGYVQFVRQVMREDKLTDFDGAKLKMASF